MRASDSIALRASSSDETALLNASATHAKSSIRLSAVAQSSVFSRISDWRISRIDRSARGATDRRDAGVNGSDPSSTMFSDSSITGSFPTDPASGFSSATFTTGSPADAAGNIDAVPSSGSPMAESFASAASWPRTATRICCVSFSAASNSVCSSWTRASTWRVASSTPWAMATWMRSKMQARSSSVVPMMARSAAITRNECLKDSTSTPSFTGSKALERAL
mmetsp:Transcript_51588/g.158979  ORF Transcript_51588/g.158979 Transcript_51588/m.158979 type:complete len:222 (-) Transcript_51588:228-893(-)